MSKIKTMRATEALEKLRSAGYLVEVLKPTPKKPLVIRFYDDLRKSDIFVTNGEVEISVIDKHCKASWLSQLEKSMK